MRIALINNARQDTGVGRYAFALQQLLGQPEVEIDHFLFNRATRSLDKVTSGGLEQVRRIRKNPVVDNNFLMKLDRLPNLLLDYRLGRYIPGGYDLYHIANQTISNVGYYRNLSRKIITVHDLIFYVHSGNPLKRSLSKFVYMGLRNCDGIISDSESTKADLIRHFGISDEKIRVVHLGVSDRFRPLPPSEVDRLCSKYGLQRDRRYIIHVGSPEPRKNVITLLKAFRRLTTDFKVRSVELLKINPLSRQNEKAAIEMGLQGHLRVFTNVPEEDLVGFYNLADVLVFPSLYEGFGFPPLEAMACGTPVITSNVSSLPEVVGDAGIMVDPNDDAGFARAMFDVLKDDSLRMEMTNQGLARAKGFDWRTTAKKTMEAYRTVSQ